MAFTEGLDIEECVDRRRVEELERRNLAYGEVSLRGTAVFLGRIEERTLDDLAENARCRRHDASYVAVTRSKNENGLSCGVSGEVSSYLTVKIVWT